MHGSLNIEYKNSCTGNNVSFINSITAALYNFKYVCYSKGVIKEKRILNLVCDLAAVGRNFMYCLCHELYKVFIKPRSLYYNKCHMGENV
jgi:hypothetical protein